MGISGRRLSTDERVVAFTRAHWKRLVAPAATLIGTCALTGFLLAAAVSRAGPVVAWLVLAAGMLVVCFFTIRPYLRWLTTSYTVTNRRIILRSGIVRRSGREVPLQRIGDVSYARGLLDRVLGCGTLVIWDPGDSTRSQLVDVPRVKELQVAIADVMYDAERDQLKER
jgi:uncharacterized membrane protein YdbT with pleckstrin-like domain